MANSAAAKQPLAFRVLPRTLEHLKRRAREAGSGGGPPTTSTWHPRLQIAASRIALMPSGLE
jgi:hypothetical protein